MMIIHPILFLIYIIAAIDQEFNETIILDDRKQNITFQKFQNFGMNVLENKVEDFQHLEPISQKEPTIVIYFQELLNGQFIGLKTQDQFIYALHQNCTLEIFLSLTSLSHKQFKPHCRQLLIEKDLLGIIYPDSIVLYNIDLDYQFELQYNFSDAILNTQISQNYVLISKGFQGLDLLNFQGEFVLKNFMAKYNILQASIKINQLLILTNQGLFIYDSLLATKINNIIPLLECVRFEYNYKLLIIQTQTKIYEYFWINLVLNQEIDPDSEVSSISIHQEYLQYISKGYLHLKIIGISKIEYNLSNIQTSTYQTNSTKIVGYQQQNNYLILQKDQQFEVVFWKLLPAYIIIQPQQKGKYTCQVDLYSKNISNFNQTVDVLHIKIYIEVIISGYQQIINICFILLVVILLSFIVYILRRFYLKKQLIKSQQIIYQQSKLIEQKQQLDNQKQQIEDLIIAENEEKQQVLKIE